jgi:hypothetical protein
VLKIPIRPEGERVAWVVDGQRALALGAGDARTLPIPVVGFISDDIEIQRVPRDVPARKIPSELCSLLNRDPKSPFHKLIGRASVTASAGAVVADTAIVATIRNSINNPFGALAPFRAAGHSPVDMQSMYEALTTYWSAVREVFKQAWGLPPGESRLMHSAGIQAMGVLMDCIYLRHAGKGNEYQAIRDDLEKMRPAGR